MGHRRFARAELLVSGVLVALEVASCLPDTPKRLSPEGGVNLSALTSHANIAGAVNISELWKIPWSQIQPISHPVGTNDTLSEIGCCLASELSCTAGGYTCN